MPTLDQTKPERAPAVWTGDLVRQRLVEAFAIMRRMPGQGVRRIGSAWPAAVLHDFRDMLHWDDARERVLDDWENTKGTYPYEVSRMDEALAWLEWLDEGERRWTDRHQRLTMDVVSPDHPGRVAGERAPHQNHRRLRRRRRPRRRASTCRRRQGLLTRLSGASSRLSSEFCEGRLHSSAFAGKRCF
jgi:hypothetical protein